MKKFFITLLAILLIGISQNTQAQSATIQWSKNLGGSNNDEANSIAQTTDGGYIVAGYSDSNDGDIGSGNNKGNSDYWIVKLDATGIISWSKNLGGSDFEEAYSIAQTTDGGYIVAGGSRSTDGDIGSGNNKGGLDYWIVKLDATGMISWSKNLGGFNNDLATSIAQTTDGGYIVAGTSSSNDGDIGSGNNKGSADYWIVKLDATGMISWSKNLGGTGFDETTSIAQTTDGGYIVAGYSGSNDGDIGSGNNKGSADYWIVKLDATGMISWSKNLGGSGFDEAYSIAQTTDGGYIVAGYSSSNDGDIGSGNNKGNSDYWIVKLDATGMISWSKNLGGTGFELAFSIAQTTDGGYIVAGFSGSTDGDIGSGNNKGSVDYWIVKLAAPQTPPSITNDDPSIDDPCSCFNPGNFILDGQLYFHELVTINSSPAETWEMLNPLNSGSAFDNAGNPLVLPQALTHQGGGVYTIEFWHLPNVGYDANFDRTAGGGPFPLSIGNSCTDCNNIPTTSEWGLIIFGLLLASAGIMVLRRRKLLSYEV